MDAPQTIIVMYHYVRPIDRERWGGLFPLSPADFAAQLDWLATMGDIVPPSALGEEPTHDRSRVVLTFDDGTRDHYDYVYPELRHRGLSGLFGVISGPACGTSMPNVHLAHWLMSKVTDERLWRQLEDMFGPERLGAASDAQRMYPRDVAMRARVKFALNFALAPAEAGGFLQRAVERQGRDLAELATAWYLTPAQIQEMAAGGMAFAVHAHRHRAYDGGPEAFLRDELLPCEQWLTERLGRRPLFYIAAFGGSNAAGRSIEPLANLLRERDYRFGFLTERGTEPLMPAEFFLRRVDCADLPRGPGGITPHPNPPADVKAPAAAPRIPARRHL